MSYNIGSILKEKNSLRLFNMCFLTHGTCQILKQFHFINKYLEQLESALTCWHILKSLRDSFILKLSIEQH